ncbi:hypothetical protein [Fluviicola sp.]|jgi:hypothetical protein|uniref:hypothetical protein n=1 Tax=Fluviicola sp. TaxID=1917219 RepID=UPI002823B59F|nr:hypothetical protein [Fluviicola sp.]MDR0802796.1 hypothetical protein [Fluviicola sp.]
MCRFYNLVILVLITGTVKAQTGDVGVNISAPKATLDVSAITTAAGHAEGIIAPRLSGNQIKDKDNDYTAAQTGAIVYATAPVSVASVKTARITTVGYYYFDGNIWQEIVANDWHITGNSFLPNNDTTKFLGTTSNTPLIFKVNNERSGYIDGQSTAFGVMAMPHENGVVSQSTMNNAFGYHSLYSISGTLGALTDGGNANFGSYNNAFGRYVLQANTTGYKNSAFGVDVMFRNTTGYKNSAFGTQALYNNATGILNSAFGNEALKGAGVNTTGSMNTAVGAFALYSVTSGNRNTALGDSAGYQLTTGSNNIAIGYGAGIGSTNTTTGSKNILIGDFVYLSASNASNELNLGNTIYGTGVNNIDTLSTGKIGINTRTPQSTLEVNGAATNTKSYDAGSTADSTIIDFTKSNLAHTPASAGNGLGGNNTFTLNGLKDGGTYTLAIQGGTSGIAQFTISGGITPKSVNNGPTIAGQHTIYTIIVMGNYAYVWMTTGF